MGSWPWPLTVSFGINMRICANKPTIYYFPTLVVPSLLNALSGAVWKTKQVSFKENFSGFIKMSKKKISVKRMPVPEPCSRRYTLPLASLLKK